MTDDYMTESYEDESVLIQTVEERNLEQRYFDLLISDEEEYKVFFLTCPDDQLIRFYNYARRLEKMQSFKRGLGGDAPLLEDIQKILLGLNTCETITNYLAALKESQINETMNLLRERRSGFLRRLIQGRKNK